MKIITKRATLALVMGTSTLLVSDNYTLIVNFNKNISNITIKH